MPGYDQLFLELRTAKAWGLTPREWWRESVDDRALMHAFVLFERTREAYHADWMLNKQEQKNKGEKGVNPYDAMKQRMGLA